MEADASRISSGVGPVDTVKNGMIAVAGRRIADFIRDLDNGSGRDPASRYWSWRQAIREGRAKAVLQEAVGRRCPALA